MSDIEIYQELLRKTQDLKIQKPQKVFDMASICYLLAESQCSSNVLNESLFYEKQDEWKSLFEGYKPNAILKNGNYQKQWEKVQEHFKPERKSPYKEMVKAILHAARFLSRFDSFETFRKEMYLICVDEKKTMEFFEEFRLYASIANMYFVKTCTFFNKTGLFDVPVVNKKCKNYLLPLIGGEDENEKIYQRILQICRVNKISCHEFQQRVEALHD